MSGEVACGLTCIPAADGSLAWVQAEVFDTYGCAASSACHNGNNPIPVVGFDLSSAEASHASLVDVESAQVAPKLRVAPNDVEGSYLVNKLTGEGILDGTSRMPLLSEEPLCDALIDGVRAWIDGGAGGVAGHGGDGGNDCTGMDDDTPCEADGSAGLCLDSRCLVLDCAGLEDGTGCAYVTFLTSLGWCVADSCELGDCTGFEDGTPCAFEDGTTGTCVDASCQAGE
jgi:hypothetical protein